MSSSRLNLVRKRAKNLYNKYNLSVPVDLNYIISQKNIKLKYIENFYGIDGWCCLQKSPPEIVINTEITYEPRRRFTIAHEIGHICIPWHTGVDYCSVDDPYVKIQGEKMINTQELEANTFASELLMPSDWLISNFELNTEDLSDLVNSICKTANTSFMACFYALENVLPEGDIFLVKTGQGEFWKPFHSANTGSISVPILNIVKFYDYICFWKKSFSISQYNVIHYKILPSPNLDTLNHIYISCKSNFEKFIFDLSNHEPIRLIPYLYNIINSLDDKYYLVVKIKDFYFKHIRSKDTLLRIRNHDYYDIDDIYSYIKCNFLEYGKVNFSNDSCLLWVKESWRGDEKDFVFQNPQDLLKKIVSEIFKDDLQNAKHMLHSINGVMSTINNESIKQSLSREQMFHFARLRFETDSKYEQFVLHHCYEQYLSCKITSLIRRNTSN